MFIKLFTLLQNNLSIDNSLFHTSILWEYFFTEDTGINERFLQKLPNGEEYFIIRQYWTLSKYIQQKQFYRLVVYEFLSNAFHDMDRAMFWIFKEASKDLEYNIRSLHSVKLWLKVKANYESANPEAPNYKTFES